MVEIKIKSPVEPLVDIEEQLRALGGIEPRRGRAHRLRQSADRRCSRSARRRPACCSRRSRTATRSASPAARASAPSSTACSRRARFDVEVVPATGLRAGQALYRRQPCRHADGRAGSAAAPTRSMRRCSPTARRAARHADGDALGRRGVRPGARGRGRGGRHRLDPVRRFELLRPASRPRAPTAQAIEQSGAARRIARASASTTTASVCDYALNRSLVSLTPRRVRRHPASDRRRQRAEQGRADPQRSCAAAISIRWSPTRRPAARSSTLAEEDGSMSAALIREIGTLRHRAPRRSASAPGRSAAGCGAAPTRPQSIAAIQASIDAGVTLIDTAPGLWPGPLARRSSARRSPAGATRWCIATKCGLVWHTRQGQPLLRPGRQAGASLSRPRRDRPRGRAEPEAARHRPYRPLHHPLAGPDDADRRDDGARSKT